MIKINNLNKVQIDISLRSTRNFRSKDKTKLFSKIKQINSDNNTIENYNNYLESTTLYKISKILVQNAK